MNVAFVVPSLGLREGQGRANLELLRHVARAGHTVDVFAANVPDEARALPGVRVHGLPRLPVWQLGNQLLGLGTTGALLRARSYDLVHADAGICGRRADVVVCHTVTARWLGLPAAVWRGSGPRGANQALATRFKARLELRQARAARAVLANSPMTADDLVDRGVDRARIEVLPFGVDPDHFRPPMPEERAGAREGFGIEPDAFVVGWAGPLGARKGFDILLEALAGDDAVLLAAGDHRGGWAERARALGVRALLPGKVTDVRHVFWASDVLAYPSRYDAFGMAVLEAMACGLPPIVSIGAGSHASVADAGIVVDDASAGAWRDAITALRRDDDRRDALADRARTLAAERTWDEAGAILLNLYDRLS